MSIAQIPLTESESRELEQWSKREGKAPEALLLEAWRHFVAQRKNAGTDLHYSLRGLPVRLEEPFAPVASDDWESAA